MKLRHICENCGVDEVLTSEEAFNSGWDYPPRMGAFGVISPRTCGNCGITTTLWWRLTNASQSGDTFVPTEADQILMARIAGEPASIHVDE